MRSLLTLTALFAAVAATQAGYTPNSHQDSDLQPGNFGKPVVVTPLPGVGSDPWRFTDPNIVIDEDGPSEEDEGVIYLDTRLLTPAKRPAASSRR